jgi:hypothetical protein
MKPARLLLISVLATAAAACSALLNEQAQQCGVNADCQALGFKGWVCDKSAGVCVEGQDIEPTGGSSGSSTSAGSNGAGSLNPSGGKAGDSSGGSTSGGASAGNAGTTTVAGSNNAGTGGAAGSSGAGGNGGSGGASQPPCVTATCKSASGSCIDNVCVIACSTADCTPHCPAGMPCRVDCGSKSCNTGVVDCTKASSCDISCAGDSCLGGVDCGGNSCSIACTGINACSIVDIVCRAKSCDIDCAANQTCKTLRCLNEPALCNVACGGVQSCGTLFQTTAATTTVKCSESGSCSAMLGACCNGTAKCSGTFAPKCN